MNQLLVDVDRTIFDTTRFMVSAWQAIGEEFNIDSAKALDDLESYYVYLTEESGVEKQQRLRYYDFGSHIEALTGRLRDEVVAAIQGKLAEHDFMYPDTHSVIELVKTTPGLELSFVTFEQPWFQMVKRQQIFRVMPELKNYPWHVVQEPKGTYIARVMPGTRGWLVDDKAEKLPENYKLIWLQRLNAKTITETNGITTINSLTAIKEAIEL